MYYEYPIELIARSARTRFQMGFARMTMHLLPDFDDIVLAPSAEGLKILGASEIALMVPGEVIRQIYENEVELSKPRVRQFYDMGVYEPIMWIRTSVDYNFAEAVVQDLIERAATIDEVDWMLSDPVVRAKAPLRNLLGYSQELAAVSNDTADMKMWLSHYAIVPAGPDDDAA